MQLLAREIRVRRIVPVEPPDRWIAEEHTPTSIGLEAMLVRIDHNRIGLGDGTEVPGREIGTNFLL